MENKTIKTRLAALEKSPAGADIVTVIPSWGDVVYINGKEFPKSEYKRSPKARVINLSWGDDENGNGGK
jgi:hypothetical protein